MNIMLGSVAPDETIAGWIETVDKEFGLSEYDRASLNYFKSIKEFCIFIFEPDWYAILEPSCDPWGRREMDIVSYYIRPEKRSIKLFLTIQRKMEELATAFDCQYIVQGSHLGDRLYKYLERSGYHVAAMRKELK